MRWALLRRARIYISKSPLCSFSCRLLSMSWRVIDNLAAVHCMHPGAPAFSPQAANLVQRLYLPSRSRFRGFHEQAAESANPTNALAPPALFERCTLMSSTHSISALRTATILFATFLPGSVPAFAAPAVPAAEWEPLVLQAKLAYQRSDYAAARDLSSRALAAANSASVPELKVAEVLNVLGAALLGLNEPANARAVT